MRVLMIPKCRTLLAMMLLMAGPNLYGAVFNVRSFGAKGDGRKNDAPAIQAAEDAAERAGGGAVYLPAGRYLVDATIVIGSNIDFYGDGDTTVLIRTNHASMIRMYGEDCQAKHPPASPMRLLMTNRHYNCVDRNIHLHDFKADGSRIRSVPLSCFLCFSGLEDSTVEHVTVVNSPQDSMFFRNGGVNLLVEDNTILMHNRIWGNGDGINIETHKEGHLWGRVVIRDNTIVTAASNFCTAALDRKCSTDADCTGLQPSTCGKGASTVAAIGAAWVDGPHPPMVTITGNHIWVGNHHYGILCNGCVNSAISGNIILPATQRGITESGAFTGISSFATPAGEPRNFKIEKNTIEGDGRPDNGRAIVVSGHGGRNTGLIVRGNVIGRVFPSARQSAVEIRGWNNIQITGNSFCGEPHNSIHLGAPGLPVNNVRRSGNAVIPTAKAGMNTIACTQLR